MRALTTRPAVLLTAAFVVSRALLAWLGIRFEADHLAWYWQFVDIELLRGDLLRSLVHLHAQPPLFNLFVGIVLKAAGGHPVAVFAWTYLACGLLLTLSLHATLVELAVDARLSAVLVGLFVIGPACILYENFLFYTYPTAALLSLSAFFLTRFLRTRSLTQGMIFFGLLSCVALSRALFHLSWLLAVLGLLAFVLRRDSLALKRLLVSSLAPLLVVALVYAKNYVLFGAFAASSWLGMSVFPVASQSVDEGDLDRLHARGRISELYRVARDAQTSFTFLDAYPERFIAGEPTGIPVLDSTEKTGVNPGYSKPSPNFNHHAYLGISRQYLRDALAVLAAHPLGYLHGVARNLAISSRPSESFFSPAWSPNAARLGAYTRVYAGLLKGTLPERAAAAERRSLLDRLRGKALLVVVLLPLVWIRALKLAVRSDRDQVFRGAVLFLAFNIAYVMLMANTLNPGESHRMFFLVEPLVVILLGLVSADLARRAGLSSLLAPSRTQCSRSRSEQGAGRVATL